MYESDHKLIDQVSANKVGGIHARKQRVLITPKYSIFEACNLLIPNLRHWFHKSKIQTSFTLGQSLNESEMSLGANVY